METVLSLVVPTHNEAEGVVTLAERVAAALEDIPYELIFADDSDDETPQRVMQLAEADARVRLVRRPEGGGRADGLASAIVAAMRQSSGEYIGVLDADLQHPPELLPKLLVVAKEADVVVASRFLPVGDRKDQRGASPTLAAQAGRTLARTLFRRVRACTDPLSGFFVFRRDVLQRVKLRPKDTHLLLEVLVRGRWSRLAEVPYYATDPQRNPEKAHGNQGMAYARQLRALVFQGEWGRGPVQYVHAGEAASSVALDAASASATAEAEQTPVIPAVPWRQIAAQATVLWLVSRVMLALLTYYSALFQASLANPNQNSVPRTNPVITPDLLLGRWLQWDGTYYVNIARVGYAQTSWTAFFPFYPFLTHLLATLLGPRSELLAAMVISNLATLVASIGLGCLVALEGGTRRDISQTILVLTAYPLAFFLAAPYTEGLFLACAVWALYAARRGWWALGIVCTLLGALSRPTGVILLLPLLYEFGRQHSWWQRLIAGVRQRDWSWLSQLPRERPWRQTLTVLGIGAAVPVAFGVFAALCAERFGDPLLFIKVHDQWDRIQLPIWTTLIRGAEWQGAILFLHQGFWSYENARNLVDFAPVVIMGVITLCSVRRMPFSFTLYMLGLLYISIDPAVRIGQNTVEYDSAGRFLLLSVPVFLLLGRWSARYAWLEMLLVGGGFLLQAAFASYYLAGGWLI
ncbi:MAG TPA: glycosyltransferase [Ktedonobacterales bacterium]|nr:glycosyltransferase [Ktedonobacterales bacterium]